MNTSQHLPLLAALAGLVLAAACATAEGAAGDEENGLAGDWILVELAGEALPDDVPPLTLDVAEGGAVSGSGGCNGFRGTLELPAAGELRVGPLAATKRGCPGPILEREGRYLRLLGRSVRWRLDGERLMLETDEPDGATLVFVPRPPAADSGR